MNFLPGAPVPASIINQIQARQKVFGSLGGDDRSNYIALQSAVPWVRLSSSVKVTAGSALANVYGSGTSLAKSNVLFNFLDQGVEGLPGYELSNNLGYRPKPGITRMEIQSHNRFGSLRTAVVTFQCWSKEQIDRLELLYMRPGYSVLLEWGWSKWIANDGTPAQTPPQADIWEYNSSAKLQAELSRYRANTSYNYDAIVGLIKNFSWKVRPDGGYDCTTSIVTTGELLESYKANLLLSQKDIFKQIENDIAEYNSKVTESTPAFEGMPVDYYREKTHQQLSSGQLQSFIDAANSAALQIQREIDLVPAEGEEKKVKVVTAGTPVATYSKGTEENLGTRVTTELEIELTQAYPKSALVQVRNLSPDSTIPTRFAVDVTADSPKDAREVLEKFVELSNGKFAFPAQSLLEFESTDLSNQDAYRPEGYFTAQVTTPIAGAGTGGVGGGSVRNFTTVTTRKFFYLEYLPVVPTVEDDQPAGSSIALGTDSPEFASKLHNILLSGIKNVILGNIPSPESTSRFNEVFNYRTLPTVRPELGGIINRYESFLSGKFNVAEPGADVIETGAVYVKMGMLLEIINKYLLRNKSEYLFRFQQVTDTDLRQSRYFTFDEQISLDPRICILPHTIPTTLKIKTFYYVSAPDGILDIELNIDHLISILTTSLDQTGRVYLFEFLEQLFADIKRVTGGMIELDLQYNEGTSVYAIVDRRFVQKNTLPAVSVFGKDSTVLDLNLVSKLTPKISSMIAISAQASPFTATEEATGFAALNVGLEDGLYTERTDEVKEQNNNAADYETFRAQLKEQLINITQALDSIYVKRQLLPGFIDLAVGDYENYCKMLLGKKLGNNYTGYNFIIPFDLNLTMRGISGLNVMQSFRIDEENQILPTTYGGGTKAKVAFIITGVEHSVDRQGWVTALKTQIYNVEGDGKVASAEAPPQAIVPTLSTKVNGVTPTNTPWSAAFITYVVSQVLPAAQFPRKYQSHTGYAQAIRKDFTKFWEVLNPRLVTPIEGDILIQNRDGNTLIFSQQTWSGNSHADVVSSVATNGLMLAIGGNVANSVNMGTSVLSNVNGQRVLEYPYFAILRAKDRPSRKLIAAIARKEHKLWNDRRWVETTPQAFNTLAKYWKAVGVKLNKDE